MKNGFTKLLSFLLVLLFLITCSKSGIWFESDKTITNVFEEIDTDNDGILNDVDLCPNTPSHSFIWQNFNY